MAIEKLERLRREIKENDALTDEHKNKLSELIESLEEEMKPIADEKQEQAKSIAGFTELSTHEATRGEKKPELLKLSLEALDSSVEEFEVSHPKLVNIANRISLMLSDIGI